MAPKSTKSAPGRKTGLLLNGQAQHGQRRARCERDRDRKEACSKGGARRGSTAAAAAAPAKKVRANKDESVEHSQRRWHAARPEPVTFDFFRSVRLTLPIVAKRKDGCGERSAIAKARQWPGAAEGGWKRQDEQRASGMRSRSNSRMRPSARLRAGAASTTSAERRFLPPPTLAHQHTPLTHIHLFNAASVMRRPASIDSSSSSIDKRHPSLLSVSTSPLSLRPQD